MDASQIETLTAQLLGEIASRRPLVQNITNYVSMDIAANALLAIGASPVMVFAPEESPELSPHIDALVVNTGTLSKAAAEAMDVAARAASANTKPWLLDPVGAGGLTLRNETVKTLAASKPSIIRGNASEIIAVARILGLTRNAARPRGVDSTSQSADAEASALALARHCACTVAATGAIDIVTDGAQTVRLANGDAIMTRVTALGCSLSSVMGAFLGVAPKPLDAAIGALALYGVAADIALPQSRGPASFRVAFLDMLANIRAADFAGRIRTS
ncbi:MAG: hydroxyethylthiazole kinase [Beijerinckiaceae bacterium]